MILFFFAAKDSHGKLEYWLTSFTIKKNPEMYKQNTIHGSYLIVFTTQFFQGLPLCHSFFFAPNLESFDDDLSSCQPRQGRFQRETAVFMSAWRIIRWLGLVVWSILSPKDRGLSDPFQMAKNHGLQTFSLGPSQVLSEKTWNWGIPCLRHVDQYDIWKTMYISIESTTTMHRILEFQQKKS